jgi:intracellular multiplication protein IcmL
MKNKKSLMMRVLFFPLIFAATFFVGGCASTAKPGVANEVVSVWANEALMTTLNYSYVNYQEQFQTASTYFTKEAWKNYLETLRISKTLVRVEKEQMVASATIQGAPIISDSGVVNGRYTWKVQMPVLLSYQNARQHLKQSGVVTMIITRVDGQLGVRGLAIDQLLIQATPTKQERVVKQKLITTKEEISS